MVEEFNLKNNIMKNKSIKTLLLLFSFISITFYGCKKDTKNKVDFKNSDESLVKQMKAWLTDQKLLVSTNKKHRLDTILNSADWKSTIKANLSDGNSLIYVPIRSSELGLEIFYNNVTNNIDSGNLIKIEVTKNTFENPEIILSKAYYETVILHNQFPNSITGKLSTYSISATFLYDYTFKEGKIVSHGIVAPKVKKQTIRTNDVNSNSVICEEYGYYLIWEYSPPTLIFTYTVCSGMPDCPPVSSLSISIGGGKQYVGVNCASNGDDTYLGGGGGNNSACLVAQERAQQFVASSEMVESNEIVSLNIRDTESPYKKFKNPSWKCLQGKILPSIYVLSEEEGTIKYVSPFPNDPNFGKRWEWESLTHKKATLVGGNMVTGTISIVTESGTPSFVTPGNGILYAGMELNIVLNFKPLAIPIPNCQIPIAPSYDVNYKTAAIFNANPQ